MGKLSTSATLGLDAFEVDPLELRPNTTEGELEQLIRAVYKQVLGNQYLMEGDRLSSAESLLRNGDITVREFVRSVAQSSLYQSLFFHSSSQYRFIELNFKHLLGRPPQAQEEISEHVQIYNEQGYETEINSYIDSDEYIQNFGDNIVPYPRSIRSVVGLKNEAFNRMFSLLRGSATNDSDKRAQLISSVAANLPTPIKPLAIGNGASYGNTEKRFTIAFSTSRSPARLGKLSRQECVVNYSQMSKILQNIQKTGGKIISISEVA
ncbi:MULTISPECIES: phycobilisome rod-core linker polypeptide [Okeania]|uniref:Photosystem I reaction center subunit XII n=1 Tax=Okeania hirsuta TaxID=1458930 RepID=A0A3N6PHH0_9CYAN|nr:MULTISPECIES: phycobilisome rod-core linker polypeptide [Okeania]NES76006.1 photosystem I reaction center subunit XII [Okeania sp. SIO1H4]NES89509.1 photosystem I reaction center subunit XII [Okeania sp. SIO2B9]NET19542.1 photosystem I reaction center subunit XII [Okeania sp. SIO1H5]NET75756.1 photosystem I reaction center subunit XII [Okeania sp. SIO1F9]NET93172.1 photosystem I reaction center subunit XII [Okeania sp. SIO1H2]